MKENPDWGRTDAWPKNVLAAAVFPLKNDVGWGVKNCWAPPLEGDVKVNCCCCCPLVPDGVVGLELKKKSAGRPNGEADC